MDTLDYNDWYVDRAGQRWQLCKATVILGIASAVLRDGTPVSGRAHRGVEGYGWIVVQG